MKQIISLAVALGAVVGIAVLAACKPLSREHEKPNILLILIDDLGYADLGAYPHANYDVRTPGMNRIAEEGILFRRAYAASSVCSPSRTGLFTGRYPQRWGGWGYRTGLPENETTLSEYFQSEGYRTGLIGKNDWGAGKVQFADRAYPLNHGYDYYFGFSGLWHEYFINGRESRLPDGEKSEPFGPLQYDSSYAGQVEGYTTEIFTDSAVAFLARNTEDPFLLVLSYNAVHDVVQQVPSRYLEKYGLEGIPNYHADSGSYKLYYNRFSEVGETSHRAMRDYYLANLACLDDQINILLEAMDHLHLTQNTMVILMGDNGGSPQSGSVNFPLSGFKYQTLEGGIRVPLAIRWPACISPGQLRDDRFSAYDILPTCLEAAGIPVPDKLDGVGLCGALRGETDHWPAQYPLYFMFRDQFAVIHGSWKLVRSRDLVHRYGGISSPWPSAGDHPRLYNLDQDPGERVDLSGVEPDRAEMMAQGYDRWSASVRRETEERKVNPAGQSIKSR